MLWELTAQYPEAEQRIYRGAELVQAGHVERTAQPGLFLVRSAESANVAYQVDAAGCSCYDFQRRGGLCKHRASVALFQQVERADAEAHDPTIAITVEPEDEAIPYTLGLRGRLGGAPCALPPQCSRCHAEAAILTHPDHLGRACLMAETFGEVE